MMGEVASTGQRVSTEPAARARIPGTPLTRALVLLGLLGAAVGVGLGLRWGEPDAQFATVSYENAAGGYSFRHPPGWGIRRQGTTTRLLSEDRSVAVSFGVASAEDLNAASEALVAEIRRRYRDVRILATERQMVGGLPAIQVFGTGTNDRGVGVRFVAISIEGPSGHPAFGITAFTAEGADPEGVLPTLNEIVASFSVT
jgi:hypothetical protein